MNTYSSLALALEDYFESLLADLPEGIRRRVEHEFLPMPWDKLSPKNRRSVAAQLDYQRDPATEGERQYWSDFFEKRDDLLNRLARWESVGTPTAMDLATQEGKVQELQQEIDRMEQALRQARGDFYPEPVIENVIQVQPTGPVPSPPAPTDQETAKPQTPELPPADGTTLKPEASEDRCAVFRSMENLSPSELAIAFVGDTYESGVAGNNMLEITARGVTRRITLGALDLSDRRSGKLNRQAGILIGLAQGLRITRAAEKHAASMKRLRDVFRTHLGISLDPFTPHTSQEGWLPKFKIVDLRGKAADRAKQLAELRTVSYEGMEDSGHQFAATETDEGSYEDGDKDEAGRWLREHDRDNEA